MRIFHLVCLFHDKVFSYDTPNQRTVINFKLQKKCIHFFFSLTAPYMGKTCSFMYITLYINTNLFNAKMELQLISKMHP